jgi:hypothetical protein
MAAREDLDNGNVTILCNRCRLPTQKPEEHAKHLQLVFEALDKHDLYAHPNKCVLGTDDITFCGHRITRGRMEPLRDKVQIIKDWP